MQRNIKIAYLLWLLCGLFLGCHRLYLREEGFWLYPLFWFLSFFGLYLGPGFFVFLLAVGFWIYDAFKIPQWVKRGEEG